MYEFKTEYMTGIELIDDEHRQLFSYVNQVQELLMEEFMPDKYDNIADILGKLRDYTKQHFADEEAYMESIQYKRIFSQKMQHQQFISRLDMWNLGDLEEIENQDAAIMKMLEFLADWLVHHILEMDTKIGK